MYIIISNHSGFEGWYITFYANDLVLQLGKLLLLIFFFFFFFFSFPEEALDCFVTVVTSAFPSQFGFCEFDKYSFKEFVFCILRIGFVCEGSMFFCI
jgi:hypothetical protein